MFIFICFLFYCTLTLFAAFLMRQTHFLLDFVRHTRNWPSDRSNLCDESSSFHASRGNPPYNWCSIMWMVMIGWSHSGVSKSSANRFYWARAGSGRRMCCQQNSFIDCPTNGLGTRHWMPHSAPFFLKLLVMHHTALTTHRHFWAHIFQAFT